MLLLLLLREMLCLGWKVARRLKGLINAARYPHLNMLLALHPLLINASISE
jgi:hypothetical protein